MTDVSVRIGAETTGVEAGAARASGVVEGFGQTVARTREAARSFAAEVRRAFTAPGSNIGSVAQSAATGMDKAKSSAQGAGRETRDLQRDPQPGRIHLYLRYRHHLDRRRHQLSTGSG